MAGKLIIKGSLWKAIGSKASLRGTVKSSILMEALRKGSGKMESSMAKEPTLINKRR